MATYTKAVTDHGFSTIGTTYSAAKRTQVNVSFSSRPYFLSNLKTIMMDFTSLDGATNTVNIKIATDATGDTIIMPSTAATIDKGITTATVGSAVINVDTVLYSSAETWYIFLSTNAAADLDSATFLIEDN